MSEEAGPTIRSRAAALVGRLLLAALAVDLGCQAPDHRREVAQLDARILTALDEIVAPLPRLSGSSLHALRFRPQPGGPCPPAMTLAEWARHADGRREELTGLGRQVAYLSAERGDAPDVLRLQALWALLSNPTPDGRERMERLLERSLASEPRSLERRNDLAAARLLQASLDGKSDDFAAALDLLDNGAAVRQPAALLVNQSYALQCLTLWGDAVQTWRQLPRAVKQSSDASPLLAAAAASTGPEAPTAPGAFQGGSGDQDPVARRRRGEWLLGEWATQRLQGNLVPAQGLLREAAAIGASLDSRYGDTLLSTSVGVIRQAEASGDRARLAALLRGHAAFHAVRGRAIYADCRPAILVSAERQLTLAASPFAGAVRLDRAICSYFANDFSTALAALGELQQEARKRSETALEGRCEWMLGLIGVVQARFAEANRHYARAIELFSRLGEDAHVAYIRSLRARSYEYGGAPQEAWDERLIALSRRSAVRDLPRLFVIFDEAVAALQGHGHRAAALDFLSEQMHVAEAEVRQTGKTDLLVFTLLARAALLTEIGRDAEAARDLEEAEQAWARLPPHNVNRNRLRVEIELRRTLADHRLGTAQVLGAVDHAIAFFARTASSLGGQLQLLKLYQQRAQIDSRRGDFRAARADLLRGAAEVEHQRLEVATMEDRARFLAQARDIFLDLVRLDLDQFHDPGAALDTLERSSNRILADATRHRADQMTPGRVLRFETLRRALPAGAIVVRFGHLPGRLLLWTFFDGRLVFEQRRLAQDDVSRQVEQCRDLLARGEAGSESEAVCDSLAQTLLPRQLLELAAAGQKRLVMFVPDEILAPLPLGALRIVPRGPYLLERFRVCYAPSLTLLLGGGRGQGGAEAPALHSALFVSDPAISTEIFPALGRLPAARRAAPRYAAHYPVSRMLTDREATVPAVLAALDRFELLHFDGHGLSNSQYPERGGLLLAPADPRHPTLASSLLSAASLAPHAGGRLRLVILGACSTGLAIYRNTAEVTGLAAAFLAHGVPEVVTAAWDVPDDQAAELLDRLHRGLASGESTIDALQAAQLQLLHTHGPAATAWAAFQIFTQAKSGAASVSTAEPVNAVRPGRKKS